jgi:DNA-binding XRE family transcriptional regulator
MNDTAELLIRLEQAEAERDTLALRLAVIGDAGIERVPAALARRLMAGEAPVRVWREYRGLSLQALAKKAAISASLLSEIEAGKKVGSVRTLAKLARALAVDIDDLVSWK